MEATELPNNTTRQKRSITIKERKDSYVYDDDDDDDDYYYYYNRG